jgi:hypothetical protein
MADELQSSLLAQVAKLALHYSDVGGWHELDRMRQGYYTAAAEEVKATESLAEARWHYDTKKRTGSESHQEEEEEEAEISSDNNNTDNGTMEDAEERAPARKRLLSDPKVDAVAVARAQAIALWRGEPLPPLEDDKARYAARPRRCLRTTSSSSSSSLSSPTSSPPSEAFPLDDANAVIISSEAVQPMETVAGYAGDV